MSTTDDLSNTKNGGSDDEKLLCGLPLVPDRPLERNINRHRESLIRYIEKKWVNHTVLHFCFLEEPATWKGFEPQKQAVRDAFKEFKELGIGLEFEEVNNPASAEFRIAFQPGGSWSYVGRDSIDLVPDPQERTMNFGWDLTTAYGRDTVLHEIGHALGFPHEHQNPNAGIVWNDEAVYSYFGGSPNFWSRDKTYYNVIRKISPTEIGGSDWDRNSIMHYHFPAGVISSPEEFQTNPLSPHPGLSLVDIQEVRKFYPAQAAEIFPELKPYLSHLVRINPGEQLDFVIRPALSRRYVMQTFGPMDTLMVLFEGNNGTSVYLSGDDDSGTNFNSRIELRLLSGRTYYLRIRLYYSLAAGQGGVMLW